MLQRNMDDPHHARQARVAEVAHTLDDKTIHVWWLPRRQTQGRQPLLSLLADYLGAASADLSLTIGAHGRPALAAPHAMLDFNWSHSGTRAVVALARRLPRLGVDLECPRPNRLHSLALAHRFFALSEQVLLEALAPARRDNAFVKLWTAKEAVLKAHGRGLAYGLDRVAFDLEAPGIHARCFAGDIGAADTWQLRHWSLSDGGFATLAWQGSNRHVQHFLPRSD